MPETISVVRQPADPLRRKDLEKLFTSPAFLFLKEVISAQCISHQVEAMNAALYPDNEDAVAKFEAEKTNAADCNKVLDKLDDLSRRDDEWFTVKLEHANH